MLLIKCDSWCANCFSSFPIKAECFIFLLNLLTRNVEQYVVQPRKPGSLLPLPYLTRSSRDPGSGGSRDTPESGVFSISALYVT
jgi:hypothetical protein